MFSSHVVKIADFGMSKQLYGSGQYKLKKQVTFSPDAKPMPAADGALSLTFAFNRKSYHGSGDQLSF